MCWSITASRCRPGTSPSVVACREPRRVLPSTASTRRRPAGAAGGAQALHERPDHRVEQVGVDRPSSRRIADSDGHRRSTPSAAATSAGQVGDPLGDRDERPRAAATAHTAAVSTTTRPWRTPRRLRGSPPRPAPSARSGATATGSGSCTPPTWSATRRWTKMKTRARLSSDDQAWCENRKITMRSRARTSYLPPACRRSSAPVQPRLCRPVARHRAPGQAADGGPPASPRRETRRWVRQNVPRVTRRPAIALSRLPLIASGGNRVATRRNITQEYS